MKSVILKHDGAPPHYSLQARDFYQITITEQRVIGRGMAIPVATKVSGLNSARLLLLGYA